MSRLVLPLVTSKETMTRRSHVSRHSYVGLAKVAYLDRTHQADLAALIECPGNEYENAHGLVK